MLQYYVFHVAVNLYVAVLCVSCGGQPVCCSIMCFTWQSTWILQLTGGACQGERFLLGGFADLEKELRKRLYRGHLFMTSLKESFMNLMRLIYYKGMSWA